MDKLVLDVGCGCRPEGNVNCDLYPQPTFHRKSGDFIGKPPNFVRCDACHLPFRTSSIYKVFSDSVIEHLDDPSLMVKEMFRVCQFKIEIVAPHRFYKSKRATRREHKYYFTKSWFARLFNTLGAKSIRGSYESFFLGVLPQMIKMEAWK